MSSRCYSKNEITSVLQQETVLRESCACMRDGQCVTLQAPSFRVACRCNQGVSPQGRDELIKMDQSEEAAPAELITPHPCLIPVPAILAPHRPDIRAHWHPELFSFAAPLEGSQESFIWALMSMEQLFDHCYYLDGSSCWCVVYYVPLTHVGRFPQGK